MPTLKIDDRTLHVPVGTRLVHAVRDAGIEIGHRCGGKARCTTCRVEVVSGEPSEMTRAEFLKLRGAGLLDDDLVAQVRLSCQIRVEDDMEVRVVMTRASEGWPDTGPVPALEIEPEARAFEREALAREVAAD